MASAPAMTLRAPGRHLTITLTVSRGFRLRLALGVWLMRLGVRILGAYLVVNRSEEGGSDAAQSR